MKSTTTQVLYATLLIQAKLASTLVDSDSSVSLVSCNFWQSLRFTGALAVYQGKILTANSTSMPLKRKAELKLQPEIFAPECRAAYPLSAVDALHCLLRFDFLTKNDCISYAKEQKFFCVKKRRTLPLNPISITIESMYLILVSTQAVPSRSETLLQCELKNEDG